MPCCIFVDNTPEKVNHAAALPDGIYIPLHANKGIATAQNIGIAKAREIGAEFVLFFDQDSRFDESLVATLQKEFTELQQKGIRVGAIGPLIFDIGRGELYKGNVAGTAQPQVAHSLISSGTLTSIAVLDAVGGMKDKLFIDLVDHEWSWRVLQHGYQLFQSGRAILPHQVGRKTIKMLGVPFLISSPSRYYFQYRNFLWLCKVSYAPRSWKYKVFIRKIFELLVLPWYTASPLQTLKYMMKGIHDGMLENL